MVKVVRVHAPGGPEALTVEDVPLAPPGPGEALVRHTAIGLNFTDVYYRTGLYPSPSGYPTVLGAEAAGVVEAVGEGVTEVRPGERVAYAGAFGGYSEARTIAAARLVPLPDGIDDRVAAASLLKGMTVQYLLRRTFRVAAGHTVLFHAGAGGVGLIAGQWLRDIGATAIATVGSPDKAALALSAGYAHAIDYRREDFVARVRALTAGAGCDVVYDSIGRDTFPASLDCLKPLGLFVSFGNSSGAVDAFKLGLLSQKGSLFATRPTLGTYTASRADLLATAGELFEMILKGAVTVPIGQTFALDDVAAAHRALESRATTGSTVILP